MTDLFIKTTAALVQQNIDEFKEMIKETRKLLKDPSYSLESRWDLYLRIQPYLETKSFYMDFDTLGEEVSWFDDFYLEKGAVQELDKDFVETAAEKFHLKQAGLDALAEEILEIAFKDGYGSFCNDW